MAGEGFSINKYADLLMQNCPKYWHRKNFDVMNEYLRVSINPVWIIVALLFSVILGLGSYFVIEANMGKPYRSRAWHYN